MPEKKEDKGGTLRLRGTVTIDLSLEGLSPRLTHEYLKAVDRSRCQFTDAELRKMYKEESGEGKT